VIVKEKQTMNKLKAVARSVSFSSKPSNTSKNNRIEQDKLEPVVGFQVTLCDAAAENTSGKDCWNLERFISAF
jgi:hypothetical protein